MKSFLAAGIAYIGTLILTILTVMGAEGDPGLVIELPEPRLTGDTSVEEALFTRRSIREYRDEPLTLSDVSQLLWAAQGITDKRGFRTAPSAGALYPLELYLVAGNVTDIPAGIYKYSPYKHNLTRIVDGDKRDELSDAALEQECVRRCSAAIVFSAVYERTTGKYGKRGIRYVHIEVGHAAENLHLQAVSLNLGTVAVGAFFDDEVKQIMNLPEDEEPLYIMPVGKIK